MTMRDTAEDPASIWDTAGTSFARWRAGDPAALDELVRVMSPVLWHVVRATGLDKEQSEDVVQTAWLALVRNAHTVGDRNGNRTSFGQWPSDHAGVVARVFP